MPRRMGPGCSGLGLEDVDQELHQRVADALHLARKFVDGGLLRRVHLARQHVQPLVGEGIVQPLKVSESRAVSASAKTSPAGRAPGATAGKEHPRTC